MDDTASKPDAQAGISLREITAETVRDVCDLEVAPGQESFVAANAVSIAEAYFSEHAWFRAIYADDTPVGFVMLHDEPEKPEYYLWRFMIAGEHQGKGYGRRALQVLVSHVRNRPKATVLLSSFVPGEGGPEGFYRKLGFEPTGEEEDGEIVIALPLDH